jgi:putative ABC transport system substrate-binding protein
MIRREFIALIGGAGLAARPVVAHAQQTKLPVIGFLNSASADGYASMASAFRQGLKEASFVEGQNVAVEYRWANNQYDRLPALTADLVSRRVDVIFANSPTIATAKAATSTVPIVFSSGDDPVRLGFVASLNKPGGNVTGVAILAGELAAKRLALLKDLLPNPKTIAVLINSDFGPSGRFQTDIDSAARALGLTIKFLSASNGQEISEAFANLAQTRVDGLLVGPGPFLDSQRDTLVANAARLAIPAAYESRATAAAGGFTSYGASVANGYRQAGIYAGRILKGEKPGDLPVILATKVEFVINLKTARELGLNVDKLLAAADEVIE